jgi:signal peptide peptidase SppA
MTGLDYLGSTAWAMPSADLQAMIAIANREGDLSPEALQAYRTASLQRAERAGVRDGVAVIGINGPLFRKANLFTSMSGATSYEQVRRDLQVALDDPSVSAILLDIDSPGGEVAGVGELANAIRAATATKPVHAYAGGLCASGALWVACAASRVTVDAAALVGSIGVVMSMIDDSAADERRGIKRVEIVSSQSPGKRPDPATDEGKARLQATVDSLAAVFVKAVAGFRGVTDATVISKFGGGGVLVGAQAVKVGLVDGIGSFEGALSALRDAPRQQRISAAVDRALSAARSAPVATAQPTAPVVDQDAIRASWKTIVDQRTGAATDRYQGVAFIPSAPAPSPAPVSEASADEIAAGWAKARAKHETAAPATAEPGTPDAVAAAGWDAARARHGFEPVASAQKGYDHDD